VTATRTPATSTTISPTLGRIMRSTAIVVAFSLGSKVVSLGQTFLIARQFGLSADYDSFVTANTIPEQIFNLIAGGALSYAFIPMFGGLLVQDKREQAWELASNVLNTVLLAALFISGIVFLAAPSLIGSLAPKMTPLLQAQTVDLMRILLVSLIIFCMSGLSIGILQSHQHFLLPAAAPLLYDLALLFGIAVLAPRYGVRGLAYGAVLGAAAHFLIQVPGLIFYKMRWRPFLNWRDPTFLRVIALMIPRALGLALLNLNLLVAVYFANNIGEGAVSAFNWGWRLMQFPETLIGTALGIVIFPTLAALSAAGDSEGKRNAMSGALRYILFAAIPAAFLLVLVGRPTVGLLEGGQLNDAGASLIYSVLVFFAPGVIVHSAVEIVARSFYADKDTVTPLFVALLSAIVNITLAYLLTQPGSLGIPGLALANTVAVTVELLVLLLILRRRWNGIHEGALVATVTKTVLASLALTAAMLAASVVLNRIGGSKLNDVIRIGLLTGVGGAAFILVNYLLRSDEMLHVLRMVAARRRS